MHKKEERANSMGIWTFFQKLFGGDHAEEALSQGSSMSELLKEAKERQKRGTRLEGLQVLDVADGDTIKVEIDGESETLRLLSVDTEESHTGGTKPVTRAGLMATEMAKKYFEAKDGGWCKVTIEFDTDEPLDKCLRNHRGTYGRLLCYVIKDGELYNLKLVEEGWSPYFVKYGPSRLYDDLFKKAQQVAQKAKKIIWDPKTNEGGAHRDYETLLPWWEKRGERVRQFRKIKKEKHVLSTRDDYDEILEGMEEEREAVVFCDLQGGIAAYPGNGAVVNVGGEAKPMSLWIPDANSSDGKAIIELIEEKYAHHGLGYCYVSGKLEAYKGKPQIVLHTADQLAEEI